MGSEKDVCPVCGQPVETVVGRYKTLGAWVPKWGPGPCHNPECASRAKRTEPAAPAAADTGDGRSRSGGTTARRS
ncbi:hypothetical protein [Streptomyces cellostaticus]|uniref:hypothetical protein n=1 Tax=Streptomyces TaxID=1883 RepID=UPI0020262493|nr:hypothetical protein [Streptomyces cellostaticus]